MIYVECKPDFTLVKTLGIPKKEIIHSRGKPNVCKQLEKQGNCKGLLDEDPFTTQPPYLKKLLIKRDLSEYDLILLNDAHRNNDLVILCPRLEEWVLKAAREVKIDVRNYNLPNDAERLHKVVNINIGKFELLIRDLNAKSNKIEMLKQLLVE